MRTPEALRPIAVVSTQNPKAAKPVRIPAICSVSFGEIKLMFVSRLLLKNLV